MTEDDPFHIFVVGTKCLLLLTLPFLALGYGSEVLDILKALSLSKADTRLFFFGAVLFVPIWCLARRYSWRPLQFICTLEHELTHAIAGVPFLLIPRRLRASAFDGGHVRQTWRGPRWLAPLYGPGQLFSSLAPYFLPTASYLLIASSFLFLPSSAYWFGTALGFLTAFHIVSTWAETGYGQPDIQQAGVVFSTIFLPVANLIAFGAIAAFIVGGSTGFARFWYLGLSRSLAFLSNLIGYLSNLIPLHN